MFCLMETCVKSYFGLDYSKIPLNKVLVEFFNIENEE